MIKTNGNVFTIETKNNSYIFHVNKLGLLIHDYFGRRIELIDFDVTPIEYSIKIQKGTSTLYNEELDDQFSMDQALLEFSFPHKGDYRETPILFKNEKYGYVFDFAFDHYEIKEKHTELKTLPTPREADDELVIYLKDRKSDIFIELHYLIFVESDVIARNIVVTNKEKEELHILKALSMNLDLINKDYEVVSLYGGWIAEGQKAINKLVPGTFKIESLTGNSSNRHNPFFMLKAHNADMEQGEVYAFNLIYSGNHYETVELTTYDKVRIMSGINPFCFDYLLKENESFETPYAIMTYSNKGMNGTANNMHNFVNKHIVSKEWRYRLRPVAINNWEATGAKFSESQLLTLAKRAKKYGVELLVLDDGWFSTRNDDLHGLGDYWVNKKKLPHGLDGLANKINKIGLKFGLWFEPESVNMDSDLYRAHPEYAVKNSDRSPSLGRHQLTLDLTKREVQEYIIESVSNVLKSANIEYVKWDMNRNISDIPAFNAGEFYHRYILGLYTIVNELTTRFPNVLFENCASGGNRFDLGMTYYFPQTWLSDDSDAHERVNMQSSFALGYPQSTFSNHVSSDVNSQLLRKTDLETRFNVAYFGVLGFELLFNEMEKIDQKQVERYLEIYKKHRETFQYGEFRQSNSFFTNENERTFTVRGEKDEMVLVYNVIQKPNPRDIYLPTYGLKDNATYVVTAVPVAFNIKKFGGLINVIMPIHLNPHGHIVELTSHFQSIDSEKETYEVKGSILNNQAISIAHEWAGTGINDGVRIMGDFGSRLYIIEEKDE